LSVGRVLPTLAPRFRTIGVGVAASLPVAAGGTGATYTTDFGS
jgi:hypothetical protein